MKKGFIIIIFALLASASFAQVQRKISKDTSTNGAALQTKKGNKKKELAELNLTKEQRGKMKEIRQANKANKAAIDSDEKLTDAQKAEKIKGLKKENATKVQSILNAEQKQKLMKMRRDNKRKQ